MNAQLMVLHWGQVSQNINVEGFEPASGVLTPTPKDGVITPGTGAGGIKAVKGSGGTKRVSGSGGNG